MPTVGAKEDVRNIGTLTAYEQLLLDKGEGLQELSDTEKDVYINNLRDFISSQNGYEAKVFETINEYAEAKRQLDNAKKQGLSERIIEQLEKNSSHLYFELEELGVTTQERLQSIPNIG